MNINYLSVLAKVDQNYTKSYVLVDSSQESIKTVIEDKINFNNADKDHDAFLTYEELSDIQLSVHFDVKKDMFELTRGLNLLDNRTIHDIYFQQGISLDMLEEELKKLDKNNDGKIDSSEVEQDLSQLAKTEKMAYQAYKLNDIREKEGEHSQNESDNKQIAALEKQIQSLKNMLSNLQTQKASQPPSSSAVSSKEANEYVSESIDNILNMKELETKYGTEDVDKVVNAVERTIDVTHNIDSIIIQTDTNMSKEDIVNLSQGMEAVAMSEESIKGAQDLSAIEQFSPASTPINIDKKNIDFTIGSIQQKIADIGGMKDKIIQRIMDSKLKKLDFIA